MRKYSSLVFSVLLVVFTLGLNAQPSPRSNNNGQLDLLEEFSEKLTIPVRMPDGIKLMTDVFIPTTMDSQVVSIDLFGNQVNIEFIPKGVQLFYYDSLNGQPNPNPFRMPMIFTRTPYNKEGDQTGEIVSLTGYAYAMQDMRGRYSSEGVYMPMLSDSWNKNPYHPNFKHVLDRTDFADAKNGNKHEDGYWSIRFLMDSLKKPYPVYDSIGNIIGYQTDYVCNGSLGMFGASALGNTQYQAAAAHPIDPMSRGLKGLMPIVATNEHYRYTGYQNGVFRDRIVTGWIKGQIFDVEDDFIDIDDDMQNSLHTSADYAFDNKFDAAHAAIDHFVTVNYDGAPCGYYPNSPGRPEMDASLAYVNEDGEAVAAYDWNGNIIPNYYPALDPNGCGPGSGPNGQASGLQGPLPNLVYSRYRNMEVPAYHLTGWWDIFTDGQIETWRLMKKHLSKTYGNRDLQKLVIGPWAHQTIGSRETGDMREDSPYGDTRYPENVTKILGFDLGNVDFEDLNVDDIINSEVISWFRYTLNYNAFAKVGEPKVRIPRSNKWQDVGLLGQIRVPAEDYIIRFNDLINYLNGTGGLPNLPIESSSLGTFTFDIPPSGTPVLGNLSGGGTVEPIKYVDFKQVPDVRFYVVGPVKDGIPENAGLGNYWFEADTFPVMENIQWRKLYLHQNGTMTYSPPTFDEGYKLYVHDPDDPVLTVGGANMIVRSPDGSRNSQGQMDLAAPENKPYTMDRPGVIQFEREITEDSLCIIGYPRCVLYAKTNPGGVPNGDPTDTDFFVRILDVYPDGRELFVVEGCINARAREYVRYMYDHYLNEDINIPFTNIETGKIYEYAFYMMPIAYTWGKGHKIKVLISSSNYTRYQVNPNLPMEPNEFFRRKPGDGRKYTFQGVEMSPRVAVQRIHFSPEHPTHIELPVYDKTYTAIDEPVAFKPELEIIAYPNPATEFVSIYLSKPGDYTLAIRNIEGKVVETTGFSDHITIPLGQYAKGIYLFEVRDIHTGESTTRKVNVM